MIFGAHVVFYTSDPEADRNFFRDVLQFGYVDAGEGWLIFSLPPAEVAFHPGENGSTELYLLCDDIQSTIESLKRRKVGCSAIVRREWGSVATITLPSGAKLGIYQPNHLLVHSKN
jgi:catechol 2,3-dioxygenase-like lactoylglutathione lyase family enzyme